MLIRPLHMEMLPTQIPIGILQILIHVMIALSLDFESSLAGIPCKAALAESWTRLQSGRMAAGTVKKRPLCVFIAGHINLSLPKACLARS